MKIYFRRINKIDLDNLKNDILNSDLKTKPEKKLPKLCTQYDTILQTILNKHAPLLTKTVSERPSTPWMTQEILKAKFDDVAWKEFGAEPVTDTIDHVTEFSAICAIELWRKQKQIFMLTSYYKILKIQRSSGNQ